MFSQPDMVVLPLLLVRDREAYFEFLIPIYVRCFLAHPRLFTEVLLELDQRIHRLLERLLPPLEARETKDLRGRRAVEAGKGLAVVFVLLGRGWELRQAGFEFGTDRGEVGGCLNRIVASAVART